MAEHFSRLMNRMADTFARPKGLVVEIGSNDGTALRSLAGRDVRILGVDPSRNLSALATASGVPTIDEFFTEELAKGIVETQGQADLIVGCNVLGHIDDLDDVCRGIKVLLGDHGAFVLEVPYLGEMLDQLEWDTIYHEHLSYLAGRAPPPPFPPIRARSAGGGVRFGSRWEHPMHCRPRRSPGTFGR